MAVKIVVIYVNACESLTWQLQNLPFALPSIGKFDELPAKRTHLSLYPIWIPDSVGEGDGLLLVIEIRKIETKD